MGRIGVQGLQEQGVRGGTVSQCLEHFLAFVFMGWYMEVPVHGFGLKGQTAGPVWWSPYSLVTPCASNTLGMAQYPSVPARFKFGPGWEGWYVSKMPLIMCREADRNCARLNSDSRSLIVHNNYLNGSLYHSKPQFSNLSNEDNFFPSKYSESV